MDFYREGKVFTVSSGSTLDLSGSTFSHKAIMINCLTNNCGGNTVNLKFWTNNTKSTAVQFSIPDSATSLNNSYASFTNSIIPVIVSEIAPAANIRVTLLN